MKLMTTLKCCHPTYEYNKTRGKCMFKQEIGRNILRGDNNGTYFYIRVRTCAIRDLLSMKCFTV